VWAGEKEWEAGGRGGRERVLELQRLPLPAREWEIGETKLTEREASIDDLLVQIHFVTEMIRWTGLAPWEFEFPFTGSLGEKVVGEGGQSSKVVGAVAHWATSVPQLTWSLGFRV
jgi:hypothetical protein